MCTMLEGEHTAHLGLFIAILNPREQVVRHLFTWYIVIEINTRDSLEGHHRGQFLWRRKRIQKEHGVHVTLPDVLQVFEVLKKVPVAATKSLREAPRKGA